MVGFGNFRRFNLWHFDHRLNRLGLGRNRRRALDNQRAPLPPNDWKQSIHNWWPDVVSALNGVGTNGDLFPVRSIADRQARHAARAAGTQVNDAARKLGRCHAGRRCGCHIGEGGELNLFAIADFVMTAR